MLSLQQGQRRDDGIGRPTHCDLLIATQDIECIAHTGPAFAAQFPSPVHAPRAVNAVDRTEIPRSSTENSVQACIKSQVEANALDGDSGVASLDA
jgi:hypothetical protein